MSLYGDLVESQFPELADIVSESVLFRDKKAAQEYKGEGVDHEVVHRDNGM